VYDPAVGAGSLLIPFRQHGWNVCGSDINESCPIPLNREYIQAKFEDIEEWSGRKPDVVVCNPPFNSAPGRKLYPEVFLRQIHKLFGNETLVVMIAPMGLRLNQRLKSARWRYLRDNWKISSILSLPIDAFTKADDSPVLFHAEVLFFNFQGLRPHYFLPEELLP
jgi:tRNA G10  N-methylase Trm11